ESELSDMQAVIETDGQLLCRKDHRTRASVTPLCPGRSVPERDFRAARQGRKPVHGRRRRARHQRTRKQRAQQEPESTAQTQRECQQFARIHGSSTTCNVIRTRNLWPYNRLMACSHSSPSRESSTVATPGDTPPPST